jgi:hypothetical protein
MHVVGHAVDREKLRAASAYYTSDVFLQFFAVFPRNEILPTLDRKNDLDVDL